MKLGTNFVLWTTIAGLFSSAVVVHVGIGIQGFYLIIVFNLLMMMMMKRLWAPRGLFFFIGFLVFSGVVGVLHGTDTGARFIKEFLGITLCAFYFCSFFRLMNFDLMRCFQLYTRVAYWVTLVGFVLWPIRWAIASDYRLHSVFMEPAVFCSVCLPAVYYFTDRWQRHGIDKKEAIVMVLAIFCSQSSVGFIGLLFGFCLFVARYRRIRFIAPALVAVLVLGVYTVSADFAMRLDDTLLSVQTSDVTGANLSTYALFSNLFVTEQVLSNHPLLGNGLGSHGKSYETYVGDLPGNDLFSESGFEGLNAEDASSLALRVLSDMGMVGIMMVFWFIWRYKSKGDQDSSILSRAIAIYFFVTLFRGGLYFGDEEFFFIVLYALNGLRSRQIANKAAATTKAFSRPMLPQTV